MRVPAPPAAAHLQGLPQGRDAALREAQVKVRPPCPPGRAERRVRTYVAAYHRLSSAVLAMQVQGGVPQTRGAPSFRLDEGIPL